MIKKFFIPHEDNDYKPHSLREDSIIAVLSLILLAFATCSLILPVIEISKQTAAIYSSVIVEKTNEDRQGSNLGDLRVNPLLVAAAQAKADDMAEKSYFAHNSPDGATPWYWIKQAGYPYLYAGENLAINFSDSEDVVKAWMNSPGHRANILNNHYTEVGVAMAKGEYEGKQTIFVVQMFGSPRVATAAEVKPTPKPTPANTEAPAPTPSVVPAPTQNPNPSNNSKVAGQQAKSAQVLPAENEEIISPTETFVAVKVSDWETIQPLTTSPLVMASTYEATWYERLLVNPSHALKMLYLAVTIFIVLSLLLYIFVEWKIQHPKNIFYGILLLVIILVLYSMHWLLILSNAAVK